MEYANRVFLSGFSRVSQSRRKWVGWGTGEGDWLTGRQADKQSSRQSGKRQTNRQAGKRQTGRWTRNQAGRQEADRRTSRHSGRQADRQAGKHMQIDRRDLEGE